MGGIFLGVDWVKSWYDAQEIGKDTGKTILMKKIENAGGLSAKELQQIGIIQPNEQLKKVVGLSDKDLRDLGLK